MRNFSTGATRDSDDGKLDFEGFFSPVALEALASYMNKHRKQADGKLRDSDNWQKGIGLDVYMKSSWRHFFDLWKIHRGLICTDSRDCHSVDAEEAACALLFNVMGFLHEHKKRKVVHGEMPVDHESQAEKWIEENCPTLRIFKPHQEDVSSLPT